MTQITVYTDPDGLWGDADFDLYDVDASVEEYKNRLTKAIKAYFPGVHVVHKYGPTMRTVEVNDAESGREESEMIDIVSDLVHTVWVDWDWVVEV